MKSRINVYFLLLLILPVMSICPQVFAELQELDDQNLNSVYGQSGISIGIKNVQIFHHIDAYTYCAPDNGGGFTLNNIQFTDGQGGDVVKYNFDYTGNRIVDGSGNILLESIDDDGNTGYDGRLRSDGLIFFNMAACEVAAEEDWAFGTVDSSYKAMAMINVPAWNQEIGLNISDFVLSDGTQSKSLGSFDIGRIDLRSYDFYIAPHAESGMDFEYDFEQHIDHVAYFYGNDCNTDYIALRDIHIGSDFGFGTVGDDPRDPSTWTTDIGKFKIGDIFGDIANNEHSKPAQFDVGALPDGSGGYDGAMVFTLPLNGSIRFEKAEFGGTDFGPGAIDGINAHRMNIYLIP